MKIPMLIPAVLISAATVRANAAMSPATVSRLEMIANTRRLVSRTVTNGTMVCTYTQGGRTWTTTNALFTASGFAKPPVYSKLKMLVVFTRAGYWNRLRDWLKTQTVDGVNAWEAFDLCNEVSSDNPLFKTWLTRAEEALGVDDATAQALLKECEQ